MKTKLFNWFFKELKSTSVTDFGQKYRIVELKKVGGGSAWTVEKKKWWGWRQSREYHGTYDGGYHTKVFYATKKSAVTWMEEQIQEKIKRHNNLVCGKEIHNNISEPVNDSNSIFDKNWRT